MSDRDRDPDQSPGSDEALAARLSRLDRQLDARREAERPAGGRQLPRSAEGIAQAIRLASEFVAGILVGAGFGWLIDWWLGTSPWGLVVFLLLGFFAGVLNTLRAAGVVRQPELPGDDTDGPPDQSGRPG